MNAATDAYASHAQEVLDAFTRRIRDAVALRYESEGPAWWGDDTGDYLAAIAADEATKVLVRPLQQQLAEVDSSAYRRGRNEALMEAQGIAERFTARATAARIAALHTDANDGSHAHG